jgi:hypothetical protein
MKLKNEFFMLFGFVVFFILFLSSIFFAGLGGAVSGIYVSDDGYMTFDADKGEVTWPAVVNYKDKRLIIKDSNGVEIYKKFRASGDRFGNIPSEVVDQASELELRIRYTDGTSIKFYYIFISGGSSTCTDNDGDGYGAGCSLGGDCNDNNANVNPGASEICGDGIDNDCSGGDLACGGGVQCNDKWSIIVFGDIQNSVEFYPQVMDEMMQWVADNKNSKNVKFVFQGGDIVNNGGDQSQWRNADDSFKIIEDRNIPFSIVPGNHDWQGRTYVNFNKYFGVNRFSNKPWWGGSITSTSSHVHHMLFSVGGQDYVIVGIGFHPNTADFNYAKQVLQNNPNRKAIINTHDYLEADGSYDDSYARKLWDNVISKNANTFAVFSTSLFEEYYRENDNVGGNSVHQFAANYQGRAKKGQGWLRIYTFDPVVDKIFVQTYDVTRNRYETDSNSQFSVKLDFDLKGDC